jgi:hypothetical protein
MAIQFDESTDYYAIPDSADLTLPTSDWCVGIWTFVSDNTGTDFQYVISNGTFRGTDTFNLHIKEDSAPSSAGRWEADVTDGSNNDSEIISSSSPGADSKWRLIVVQRRGVDSEMQMWFCEPGQTAVKQGSDILHPDTVDGSNDWNIGRRQDGSGTRYYGSIAAEFFKGDFSLSQSEIEAIAAGNPVYTLGKTPDVYLQMKTAGATQRDLFGSNDATENGSPTTAAEHAPIVMPPVVFVVAPAGEDVTVTPTPASMVVDTVSPTVVLGSITVTSSASGMVVDTVPPAVFITSPPISGVSPPAISGAGERPFVETEDGPEKTRLGSGGAGQRTFTAP